MSASTSGLAIEIQIFDGDKVLTSQVLDQTKIIVGRILSADFRVSDARVSRIHALLERLEDGNFRLTDLASTHGTFVNGERVVEKVVTLHDQIQLASLKLKITLVSPERAAIPEAPTRRTLATLSPGSRATPSDSPVLAQASVDPSGAVVSQVRVSKEATAIRSLKETARTRGVLDPAGATEELELTVYWEETILAVDHYRRSSASIRIGDGPGNTYVVPSGLVNDHFEFVKVQGQSAEVFLNPQMKGSARVQGRMQTLEELSRSGRSSITLSGQDIAKIRVGSVNFFLMFVPEPPAIPKSRVLDQGPLFWATQFSVVAFVAVLLVLSMVYRQPIEGKVSEFPEKLRKILVEEYKRDEAKNLQVAESDTKPPEIKKDPTQVVHGKEPKHAETVPDAQMVANQAHRGGNEGEGARERGAEGKRGLKNTKNETGITNRPKVRGGNRTQDADHKAHVANQTPGAGGGGSLLDSLRNTGLGAKLQKVAGNGTGGGGGAQGNDPLDVSLSGTGGGGLRNGRGSGGSGLQGTGTGGGGKAVGVGGLGSRGFGGGAKGDGIGSIPGKGDFVIGTETAEVTVLGSLTREEIEAVVSAHRNEVQFCYQRELQQDAKLAGKLAFKWTIVSGGRVELVKTSDNSTGSKALENCVRDKISRWKFPAPAQGSQAVVDWPWTFKPQGL